MQVLGLSKDLKVQQYLKSTYGLEEFEYKGLPAFKKDEAYFLGGFKGFYGVLVDEEKESVTKIISEFFREHKESTSVFSVSDPDASGQLIHYLLRIKTDLPLADRFDLYNKKTRNQVRKSYLNDLRVEVGVPPRGFYDLYIANIERLKSIPKNRGYFEVLEEFLGEAILCVSIFAGDVLVGCNYAIVSQNYITLLLNLSNSKYWNLNINDRLYDELIAWAIKNNIEFIDFGPSVRRDESHNHFKEGFGALRRSLMEKRQGSIIPRARLFLAQKMRNLRLRFLKFRK